MAEDVAKTQEYTHVRVSVRNRERAKEISRKLAAKESRDVHYSFFIDEVLDQVFTEKEKELGITYENA